MTRPLYKFYTYVHKRADNGEVFYVGSAGERRSENPSKNYMRARDRGHRRSTSWERAVADSGGFTWEIVHESCCEECARKKELALIKKHRATLVNERVQAIAWPEKRRKAHGLSGKDHPNYGKKLSKETIRKKSETLLKSHHLRGKKLPEQWRKNIAKAVTGRKNIMFGRTGEKHPNSKAVVDSISGKRYPSISAAATAIGLNMKTLHGMLTGFRKNRTSMRFA